MHYFVRCLIYLLMLVSLTGCFGPVKTPPVKTYTLSPEPYIQASAAHRGRAVLMVNPPTASPGYETSDMIYTTNEHQLSHFSRHTWVAPPAKMLQPLLVTSWQNSGCLHAVVAGPYAGKADYTANTQLLVLQQEFSDYGSVERMAILVSLVDNASGAIIASRQFTAVVPAQSNPYAGVVAANQAVREILSRSNAFICNKTAARS